MCGSVKKCLSCKRTVCIYDEQDSDESRKAYQRRYYREHSDAMKKSIREYHARNRANPAIVADAERLRAWRKDNGYSREAVAKMAGVSASSVSMAENAYNPMHQRLRELIGG